MKKTLEFIKRNKIFCLFLLTTFLGIALRIGILLSKDIFTDEIFYTEVARLNSFFSLIQTDIWLKDHGQLYLVFLKIVQNLTTSIVILRFSNLILYVILSFSLYKFFSRVQRGITALIPVILFSFLPYFALLNSYVSPYNFVVFFSILSFIFISRFILFSETSKDKILNVIAFLVTSTLAFYSDYSVILFYLSLIPVIFLLYKWNEKDAEDLVLIGLGNLILVVPGLYILSQNFQYFAALNTTSDYSIVNFGGFINNFCNIILFNTGIEGLSYLIFVVFAFLILVIFILGKKSLKFLSYFTLTAFLIDIVFLFVFNTSYFVIFTERIFWFFYFLLILGFYLLFVYGVNHRKLTAIYILALFVFISVKWVSFDIPPFGRNISYGNLVQSLIQKNLLPKSNIVFIDVNNNFFYVPLKEYYFKGYNLIDLKDRAKTRSYFNNMKINVVARIKDINSLKIDKNGTVIFVIFDPGKKDYLNLKDSIEKFKNSNKININQIYYQMICKESDCSFYQFE